MTSRRLTMFSLVAGVVLAGPLTTAVPSAVAGTITSDGAIYSLTYTVGATAGGNTTYDITLTDNTSGLTGLKGTAPFHIVAVAIQVWTGGRSRVVSAALGSAPGGVSDWTLHKGGTDGGGCDGTGNFYCAGANSLGTFNQVPTSTLLTWVFDIKIPTGDLATGTDKSDIKAVYDGSTGTFAGVQLSESITLTQVPEPASMALLGTALLGAYGLLRRKLRA